MSILTPSRPGAPTSRRRDQRAERAEPPEDPQARAARLRLRRRLVWWSAPFAVLLLLVAIKLLTMVSLGQQARDAYAAGNITGVEQAADRLGFLNLVEAHKAAFAAGDAKVLAGDLDGARADFEQALTLAPEGSTESCQIRVNLVRSLVGLGAAARTTGGPTAAKPYDDRVQQVVADAPEGCLDGQTGQELGQAQQEAQQQQQPDQQGQTPQPDPGQNPGSGAGEDKQQQLDQKTQDNLQQRGTGTQRGRGGPSGVAKPW